MAREVLRSSAPQESGKTRFSQAAGTLPIQEALSSPGIAGRNGSPAPAAGRKEGRRFSVTGVISRKGLRSWRPFAKRLRVATLLAAGLFADVRASDLPEGMKLQTFVRPSRSSSTPDRAFEYVQKTADFALADGTNRIVPSGVGYICLLEHAQGDQVLVTIRSQGLRGWAPASGLVPLNHAETFFSKQIEANPRDAFAFLMRGVVRFENDDLDHACRRRRGPAP